MKSSIDGGKHQKKDAKFGTINKRNYLNSSMTLLVFVFEEEKVTENKSDQTTKTESCICLILNNFNDFFVVSFCFAFVVASADGKRPEKKGCLLSLERGRKGWRLKIDENRVA